MKLNELQPKAYLTVRDYIRTITGFELESESKEWGTDDYYLVDPNANHRSQVFTLECLLEFLYEEGKKNGNNLP